MNSVARDAAATVSHEPTTTRQRCEKRRNWTDRRSRNAASLCTGRVLETIAARSPPVARLPASIRWEVFVRRRGGRSSTLPEDHGSRIGAAGNPRGADAGATPPPLRISREQAWSVARGGTCARVGALGLGVHLSQQSCAPPPVDAPSLVPWNFWACSSFPFFRGTSQAYFCPILALYFGRFSTDLS